MNKATTLYDKAGCVGFVHRPDGYWFIQNGQLVSTSTTHGIAVEKMVQSAFLNERTPLFTECLAYITSEMKHRAAHALYVIGKKITSGGK